MIQKYYTELGPYSQTGTIESLDLSQISEMFWDIFLMC